MNYDFAHKTGHECI